MKKIIKAGAIDQTIDIFIQDSASTTGAGKTGLVYNTASLTCYYRKGATGSATALTLVTQTVGGAHSDGGFVEIDATNMPGMYRLDLSDTIVAAAGTVTIMLKGASGMAPLPIELQVVAANLEDGVRLGLTALPNAAANAAGGLPISAAGGLDLDAKIGALTFTVAGKVDSNATHFAGTAYATALAAEVDAVWDEATSGHATAGTTGKAITNVDVVVSTRASQTSLDTVATYVDTEVAAIKAKTDSLTFTVAGQVDANIQSVNDVAITGNGSTTPFNV